MNYWNKNLIEEKSKVAFTTTRASQRSPLKRPPIKIHVIPVIPTNLVSLKKNANGAARYTKDDGKRLDSAKKGARAPTSRIRKASRRNGTRDAQGMGGSETENGRLPKAAKQDQATK